MYGWSGSHLDEPRALEYNALADDYLFPCPLISAQVKRAALIYLCRRDWFGKRALLPCFAAGLFLLLKDIIERATLIAIDQEYQSHEAGIEAVLLRTRSCPYVKSPP